jgi:hypothetical protein
VTLASVEATLKETRVMVGEAAAKTALAKSARDEARKLAKQAMAMHVVCSQPSSDWSEEREEGARERKKELLEADMEKDLEAIRQMEQSLLDANHNLVRLKQELATVAQPDLAASGVGVTPDLESQAEGGVLPDLVVAPVSDLGMGEACALPSSVTGLSAQLQARLGPQHPGLVTEPAQDLGLVAGRVDGASVGQQMSPKPRSGGSSPGEVAAEALSLHWVEHDSKYKEYGELCIKKRWSAAMVLIASLLAKGRDIRRRYSSKLLPAQRKELGEWVVEYGLQVRAYFRWGSHDVLNNLACD